MIEKSKLFFALVFIFLFTIKAFGDDQPKFDAYTFGFLFTKITVG